MAKVINLGWVKESDPRYQEGWTVSVTLGLNERTRPVGTRSGEATVSKPPAQLKQGKRSKARQGK